MGKLHTGIAALTALILTSTPALAAPRPDVERAGYRSQWVTIHTELADRGILLVLPDDQSYLSVIDPICSIADSNGLMACQLPPGPTDTRIGVSSTCVRPVVEVWYHEGVPVGAAGVTPASRDGGTTIIRANPACQLYYAPQFYKS